MKTEARIKRLEEILTHTNTGANFFNSEDVRLVLDELIKRTAELKEVREALRFYADEDNWAKDNPMEYYSGTIWNEDGNMDTGQVARAALGKNE